MQLLRCSPFWSISRQPFAAVLPFAVYVRAVHWRLQYTGAVRYEIEICICTPHRGRSLMSTIALLYSVTARASKRRRICSATAQLSDGDVTIGGRLARTCRCASPIVRRITSVAIPDVGRRPCPTTWRSCTRRDWLATSIELRSRSVPSLLFHCLVTRH